MSADQRWPRLAADIGEELPDNLLPVTVDRRPGLDGARFISKKLPSGNRIEVHDAWWRKNHSVWIGYQVWVEDREGIERRRWPITKKRSEVVAAVREAIAADGVVA